MNLQFINSLGRLIKFDRKLSLFLASLIISTSFFILKNQAVESLSVDISSNLGQLSKQGVYNFGDYTGQVNNLIKTRSLVANEKVLNRYPPGYPLLLYSSFIISKVLQIKLSYSLFLLASLFIAFSTVIIGEIAYLFYKTKILAVSAGLLYTTHPYILQGFSKIMSVTPFMTFFYFSLLVYFIFITREYSNFFYPIVIGFLLGIAMLIRPIGLFLPIVLSILTFVYIKKLGIYKRLLISLIITLSSIVTILPWQIINYVHGQRILLSSDEVASIKDGVSFNHSRKNHLKLPADVDSLAIYLSTSRVTTRSDFFKIAFRKFINKPITMVKLILIKSARSWYGAYGQEAKKERIKLFILGVYFVLTLLALFKINFKQRAWRILGMTNLLLILYFWAMTILVVSMARYMYPIFGLTVVFIPAICRKS